MIVHSTQVDGVLQLKVKGNLDPQIGSQIYEASIKHVVLILTLTLTLILLVLVLVY